MDTPKNKLKAIGGLLLHGAINCGVASINTVTGGAGSILVELAKSITGNLVSNHIAVLSNFTYEKTYDKLAGRLKGANPEKVNHDLERLFRESAVVALQFIKSLFLAEIKEEERVKVLTETEKKEFLEKLTSFFDVSIDDLKLVVQNAADVPLNKEEIKEPKPFLENMAVQTFRMAAVEFDKTTHQKLVDFYAEKLPYCFDLAFKEALKNDDHAFKAFQIWVLEEIRDQNVQLISGQEKILGAIANISDGGNLISKQDFDKILDAQTEKIYTLLQQDFSGIRQELERITDEIRQYFNKLYKLQLEHFEVSKQSLQLIQEILAILKTLLEKLKCEKKYAHELNLIPRHTDEFIGRENDLEKLADELKTSSKIVLVNGIGGIGKTTLAKNFIQLYKRDYDHIAWVEIKQNDTQSNNLPAQNTFISAFAYDKILWKNGLQLEFSDSSSIEERFNTIIHTLKNIKGRNLLVIDNAKEELKKFNNVLPAPPEWQVLVTSRNTLSGFIAFYLERLSVEKSIELFSIWYKADREEIIMLIEEIDYHTLMIEMLAKTLQVSKGRLTIQFVTERLKALNLNDSILQRRIEITHSKEETVLFKHLLLTFQMSDLEKFELQLLKKIYFLLPQLYSFDDIISLFELKENEIEVIDGLESLAKKGWLKKIGEMYSMHRLIYQIVFYQLNPTLNDAETLINTLTRLIYFDSNTDKNKSLRYLPFAQYVVSKIEDGGSNISLGNLLNNLGSKYKFIHQYKDAQQSYEKSIEIRRKVSQNNSVASIVDLSETLSNLGSIYSDLLQFEKAIVVHKESIEILRRLNSSDKVALEPTLASSLNNIGSLYRTIHQMKEAEISYNEALEIRRRLTQSNPVAYEYVLYTTLNNLGNLYKTDKQDEKAETTFNEALQIIRKLAAKNSTVFEPELAMTLNNLGSFYNDNRKKYVKAEIIFQEALEIRKRLVASNPAAYEPNLALTLRNLGLVYASTNKFQMAKETFLSAIEIFRKITQNNIIVFESNLSMTLKNLGQLYSKNGHYESAKSTFNESLNIKAKSLSAHPRAWDDVVELHLLLTQSHIDLNHKQDALEEIKKGMITLLLYCHNQIEANSYLGPAQHLAALCGIDFNQLWHEKILPEAEKIRNSHSK